MKLGILQQITKSYAWEDLFKYVHVIDARLIGCDEGQAILCVLFD
jgi:hypothetical protein